MAEESPITVYTLSNGDEFIRNMSGKNWKFCFQPYRKYRVKGKSASIYFKKLKF